MYSVEEVDGEVVKNPELQPMRIVENGIAGSAEEISSDIVLPETRIPSTPEVGSESNSGDIQTEWNIDEQDEWFAGVFCGEWQEAGDNKKTLTLGDKSHSFSFFEKFPQEPLAWQHYKKEFVNSLSMDFATDSFVKLTWNFMGSNNPKMLSEFPLPDVSPVFKPALKSKSFITKSGMWLKIGDDLETLEALRQCPSMNLSINNNLEKTPALGEDESIENSLGDFVVEGSMDVYNVDERGIALFNDATEGKDKVIQIRVGRNVNGVTTSYKLTLNVHLGAPTKSRNGNKLQFSVPFKVNDDKDLCLEKEVAGKVAAVPVFTNEIDDATYTVGDDADELDGTATVSDNGEVSYSWKRNSVEVATTAKYKPSTATAGVSTYIVTATNTVGSSKQSASQAVKITVNESE